MCYFISIMDMFDSGETPFQGKMKYILYPCMSYLRVLLSALLFYPQKGPGSRTKGNAKFVWRGLWSLKATLPL